MLDRIGRLGDRSTRLIVVLSFGWFLTQLGRQALPPLLPTIIEQFSVSPGAAGFVLTALSVLYAAAHYPGGRLSDQLSRKPVLAAGIGLMVAGFVALGFARTYAALLLSVVSVGIGAGLYFITMRVVVFDLAPSNQGWAIGVNMAAGNVGAILAAGLVAFVLTGDTWQSVFVAIAAGLVVTLLCLHRMLSEPVSLGRVELHALETIRRVFGTARIRRLVVAYSLVVFVWQGGIGFLPTFLQATKGFSPALASGGFAFVWFVGIVFMPISGTLSDRFSRMSVTVSAIFACGVGVLWLVVAGSAPAVFAAIAVFGAGLMSFPSAMQAYLLDIFPSGNVGGDFGVFKTIYTGVGAFGPTSVGVLAGRVGYSIAYLTLLACLAVALVILYRTG
ncbi:MFS transporter [Halovivax limisalsi]|uniref:MFS transporter n=1 Tax=Halovivax limisalsi TaxID=1453760 RepID=UPI001FFC563B|nr:MFS transporter [Halovivax limisalsi]